MTSHYKGLWKPERENCVCIISVSIHCPVKIINIPELLQRCFLRPEAKLRKLKMNVLSIY